MIFQTCSHQVWEHSNDDHEHGCTADELGGLVEHYVNARPDYRWKYWGKLTVSDRKEKEISRIFANWSSALRRKAGRPQFRILTGAEIVGARIVDFYRLYSVDFHFFIAGVLSAADFRRDCKAQWLNLGGHSAWIQEFDWPWAKGYLNSFPPDRRFELELKFGRDFESRNVRKRNIG